MKVSYAPSVTDDIVAAAVASSVEAFRTWRETAPPERGRALLRLAGLLRERAGDVSVVESLDSGKPIGQARRDVEVAACYFEFYAGAADKIHGETIPIGSNGLAYTEQEPVGVTAHVVPWNFPLTQAARG